MKPASQVRASAANMDRALAAGMPRHLLLALVTARADRAAGVEPGVDPAVLAEALAHPGAVAFDETFVRRELRR